MRHILNYILSVSTGLILLFSLYQLIDYYPKMSLFIRISFLVMIIIYTVIFYKLYRDMFSNNQVEVVIRKFNIYLFLFFIAVSTYYFYLSIKYGILESKYTFLTILWVCVGYGSSRRYTYFNFKKKIIKTLRIDIPKLKFSEIDTIRIKSKNDTGLDDDFVYVSRKDFYPEEWKRLINLIRKVRCTTLPKTSG